MVLNLAHVSKDDEYRGNMRHIKDVKLTGLCDWLNIVKYYLAVSNFLLGWYKQLHGDIIYWDMNIQGSYYCYDHCYSETKFDSKWIDNVACLGNAKSNTERSNIFVNTHSSIYPN